MTRSVTADTETREMVTRDTTIKATDKTTVLGTATLMAGHIQQVTTGDYAMATGGKLPRPMKGDAVTDISGQQSTTVAGNISVETAGALTEKIAALRKSVAAGQQVSQTVHIGSER